MTELSKTYYMLWSFVTSGLAIYFLLCMLIYLQSKQKSFLYYGLYNFFLLTYVFTKTPFHIDEIVKPLISSPFASYNWFSQVIYNSMLFMFYRAFLDMNIHFPRFDRLLHRFLIIQISVASSLFAYTIISNNHKVFDYYFLFVFIPIMSIFVIYALYISLKIPSKLGYFIVAGVIFYNFFAYYSLYDSHFHVSGAEPLNFFYIGIILESIVFILGLGYKVKLIYAEKINAQKRIIEEQNENQLLRENHQKELEKELEEKVSELKLALQKSEDEKLKTLTLTFENEITLLKLESLRNQMNPHFIFNALNSIKVYLIENDKEKAVYYLNKFSKLIRKILESSRVDSISLEEELEIIELYMNIENIRFDKKIQFSVFKNDINLNSIKVPALILQPFIENSLWHGLMLKEGDKSIEICVSEINHKIILTITDNGIGRKKASENVAKKTIKKESLGINFAKERLDYFNKKHNTNYEFTFTDLIDENEKSLGTKIEFYL
jgi:sensor histidine kinase YesM